MNDTEDQLWLIVDDDAAFADALARGISRRGDRVLIAQDAASALAHAAAKPGRIVLDMRLGNDSGLQLLPKLRAALPESLIVVLTGYASIATAIRAVKDGADNYLPKPVLLRDLLAVFDSLATQHQVEAGPNERTMSPRRLEWEHIQRVLEEEHGNISSAARRLGMHRRTLQRKLTKRPVSR